MAWVGKTERDGVRFLFEKKGMDAELIALHFAQSQFQVESPCLLTGNIANRLGLQEFELRPGTYSIKQSKRYFWVDF
jgi:hypothetical protein